MTNWYLILFIGAVLMGVICILSCIIILQLNQTRALVDRLMSRNYGEFCQSNKYAQKEKEVKVPVAPDSSEIEDLGPLAEYNRQF